MLVKLSNTLSYDLISSWDNLTIHAFLTLHLYSLNKLDADLINFSVNIDAENTSGRHYTIIIATKTLQNTYPICGKI